MNKKQQQQQQQQQNAYPDNDAHALGLGSEGENLQDVVGNDGPQRRT
jgi:hypothetical protein